MNKNQTINYAYFAGSLLGLIKTLPDYVSLHENDLGIEIVDRAKFRNNFEDFINKELTKAADASKQN
jgi:hypothetical protein